MIGFYTDDDEVADLQNPDELIEPRSEIVIRIDYPLHRPAMIEKRHEGGFTRAALATAICEAYHQVYKDEAATQSEQSASGLPLNRGSSNGMYGISMHDITDLYLEGAGRTADGVWHVFAGS